MRLNSFRAAHYRGIDGLSLPHLSKANLVTGENGVGKTALIEAMWLFAGRYNPGLLWNANVQRSFNSTLNPISRLTDGQLQLSGVEDGKCHNLEFVFEKIEGTPGNTGISGALREDAKKIPPVVGHISIFLDGEHVKESEGIHLTPSGVVLHNFPRTPVGRPTCVIESTRFHHETSAEYLQRYSSLVREGRKKDLVKAIGMVAESVNDVEMLTDDSGESYLSVSMNGGSPRPLHDLGGGLSDWFVCYLDFPHREMEFFCRTSWRTVFITRFIENYGTEHDSGWINGTSNSWQRPIAESLSMPR